MRRKPRLQLRMPTSVAPEKVRRALNLALMLYEGKAGISIDLPGDVPPPPPPPPGPSSKEKSMAEEIALLRERIDRLHSIASVLVQDAPGEGVRTVRDALHILGFAPGTNPDKATIRARFRMLATIHHPDSEFGAHERMSLLNQAMETLLKR